MIWVCPLAFEFLGLFIPFWLSHDFFSFLIEICPPVWGVILVGICFHERKIIQAQEGIARDVLILESERNNKDGLSSFQAQAVKINKLWPHPVWWFGLCKDAFHGSWATSLLHNIIHTFKNTWFKSRGVKVFIQFFSFLFFFTLFVYNLVTSMMELLDSLVILQVECEKYHFWMNIKLFLKSKYQIKFSKLQ